MANSKIDLFGILNGLDFHLEITPSEGESAMTLLQQATKKLREIGAQPRPVPQRGGSSGRGGGFNASKPQVFVNGLECEQCGGGIIEKTGTSKAGKPYTLRVCATQKEGHYKKFL
jgi:hypothetical protein